MIVLQAKGLGISFGGLKAVTAVDVTARKRQILSIIGPNGAGKTTLLNILSGVYTPTSGAIWIEGRDVTGQASFALAQQGLARTFQNLQIFDQMSVLDNVVVGRHRHEGKRFLSDLFGLPASRRQTIDSRRRASELVTLVGLESQSSARASTLSYGALKRLEIARALAAEPAILMLDEPAAGCNPRETAQLAQLVRHIADEGTAIILVEHDMKLVMGISDEILVLVAGRPLALGPPAVIRSDPAVISAYLGTGGLEAAHA